MHKLSKQSELSFENELISYLTQIGGTKQWVYEPELKTTDQLWLNFKQILEQNNAERLDQPLSELEFAQVKQEISSLTSPYRAGQFLYGLKGTSQVEVDLDDGRHVFLTVFDQDQVGAGNTKYQVVNQIERPAIITGKKNRRFDVTLLINGLPIIQIEEKAEAHDAKEALNQIEQYINEDQYSDIFATVQILVGMTPTNIRYMANTTMDKFSTAFAFHWQREQDNSTVRDWREFSAQMLSIPMAHQMATSYMILDGTQNKQMLKVMRPYQVYATRRIIEKLRRMTFGIDPKEAGYIWHTTGSGKTISSFKAAWLASRLPNVDRVVFMVDRVALTNQTAANYAAYDPDSNDENKNGVVADTANVNALARKLKSASGIIVTSIQKMEHLVKRKGFQTPKDNIVFIVDEAHRSTPGETFQLVKKAFPKSAWIGYTGTPSFTGITTGQIFGDPLHIYTIREAIADRNVLGFKVDFNTTLSKDKLKTEYLPKFYQNLYPKWTEQDITAKISTLNDEDMDDLVKPGVYDMNQQHVELVVKDILGKWRNRSDDYRYNAMLTTHVGGGKASTPMAMMYYREFKKQNQSQQRPLKVAVTFSQDTTNGDNMLTTNRSLGEVMQDYSQMFGGHYDDTNVKEYTENVVARLNRTIDDGQYLDLVIVIDQLLTGFDAPKMNTLYVDRTMQGATLIQAYSRTNRIENMEHKPFGRIVNYRWPVHAEKLMNEALTEYANRSSAFKQDELLDPDKGKDGSLTDDGILAADFAKLVTETKTIVANLSQISHEFTAIPLGENEQEKMYQLLTSYNSNINKLKQDDNYSYAQPQQFLKQIGLTETQETMLTATLANELKEKIAKKRGVDFSDLNLEMTHVNEVRVNYDYLSELLAQLANDIHDGNAVSAQSNYSEVNKIADQMDDRKYANQVKQTATDIFNGDIVPDYPMKAKDAKRLISENTAKSKRAEIGEFRKKWGLLDVDFTKMNELIEHHILNADDLNLDGTLSEILRRGQQDYRDYVTDEKIRSLSKIKYRNELRQALEKLADKIIKKY